MQLMSGEVSNTRRDPVILVHGGAWDIPDEECEAHEKGLFEALETGKRAIQPRSSAIDTVVQVLTKMESSGIFDAGCGAVLNRDGEVELDAGVMCGESKNWGAVAGIKHFKNPIKIAHEIAKRGIGDSPLPGCGFFANDSGAASATGWGEAIAGVGLCREAVCYIEQGLSPLHAVTKALGMMHESVKNAEGEGATGGLIVLDAHGHGAWGYTTPRMARGWTLLNEDQRFIKVT